MRLSNFIASGYLVIDTFKMLVFVILGLMTIWFDGGLMEKMNLKRESFWAKVFGVALILVGVGAWIGFLILG